MKKLIAPFILITLFSCETLKPAVLISPIEFESEIKINELNKSKEKLYVLANDWMISIFNDAESVIQFSDKEEGVIIGKYLVQGQLTSGLYGITSDSRIYAKITINLKDNAAKIHIIPTKNVSIRPPNGNAFLKSRIKGILESFETKIKRVYSTQDW